jgi:multiple sugar transport system permease protein
MGGDHIATASRLRRAGILRSAAIPGCSPPFAAMTRRSNISGWSFIAFPVAIILLFTALPTLAGAGLSFCEWDGGGWPRFVGLENYRALLQDDPQFRYAVRNTILFTIVTVPITTILAFLFAVAMGARWFLGRTTVRTIFFMPTVVSIVAIGFIWRWVLDPQAGLLNAAIRAMPLSPIVGEEPPMWLGDTPWALGAIMFIQIWRNLGFCVVLYLAALSQIPRSLYEAASVDGAGSWRVMIGITWPAVRPTTAFLLITGAIWALQVFDLVWVITGRAQQRYTDVLNTHLYREFEANRLGYAAAIGVIVLILSAIVTAAQFRWLRATGEGRS